MWIFGNYKNSEKLSVDKSGFYDIINLNLDLEIPENTDLHYIPEILK